MASEYPIRIDYDDQGLDFVGKINRELAKHNLVIESDNKEHDGFELLRIVKLEE